MALLLFVGILPLILADLSVHITSSCDDAVKRCSSASARVLTGYLWTTQASESFLRCQFDFGDGSTLLLAPITRTINFPVAVADIYHSYAYGGKYTLRACCGLECINSTMVNTDRKSWVWLRSSSGKSSELGASLSGNQTGALALPDRWAHRFANGTAGASVRLSFSLSYAPAAHVLDTPLSVSSVAVSCWEGGCTVNAIVAIPRLLAGAERMPVCFQTAGRNGSIAGPGMFLNASISSQSGASVDCILLTVLPDVSSANAHALQGTWECMAGNTPRGEVGCQAAAGDCITRTSDFVADTIMRPRLMATGAATLPSQLSPAFTKTAIVLLLAAGAISQPHGGLTTLFPIPAPAIHSDVWTVRTSLQAAGLPFVRTVSLWVGNSQSGVTLGEVEAMGAGFGMIETNATETEYKRLTSTGLLVTLQRSLGDDYYTVLITSCTSNSMSTCSAVTEAVNVDMPCFIDEARGSCTMELSAQPHINDQNLLTLSFTVDGAAVAAISVLRIDATVPVWAGLTADIAACNSTSPCTVDTVSSAGLLVQSFFTVAGTASVDASFLTWDQPVPDLADPRGIATFNFTLHVRDTCGGRVDAAGLQTAHSWLQPLPNASMRMRACAPGLFSTVCGSIYAVPLPHDSVTGVWVAYRAETVPIQSIRTGGVSLAGSRAGWLEVGSVGYNSTSLPLPTLSLIPRSKIRIAVYVPAEIDPAGLTFTLVRTTGTGSGRFVTASTCAIPTVLWEWPYQASRTLSSPTPVLVVHWDGSATRETGGLYSVLMTSATAKGEVAQPVLVGNIEVVQGPVDISASVATVCTGSMYGCGNVHPVSSSATICHVGVPCVRAGTMKMGGNGTFLVFLRDSYGVPLALPALEAWAPLITASVSNVSGHGSQSRVTVYGGAAARVVQLLGNPLNACIALDVSLFAASVQVDISLSGLPLPLSPLWLVSSPPPPSPLSSHVDVLSCAGYGTVRAGRTGTAALVLKDEYGVGVTDRTAVQALLSSGRLVAALISPVHCAPLAGVSGASLTLSKRPTLEGTPLLKFASLCSGLYRINVTLDGVTLPVRYNSTLCPLDGRGCRSGDGSAGSVCVQPGAPLAANSEWEGIGSDLVAGRAALPVARLRLRDAFGQRISFSSLAVPMWPIVVPGEDSILTLSAPWSSNVTLVTSGSAEDWATVHIASNRAGSWPLSASLLSSGLGSVIPQSISMGFVRVHPARAESSMSSLAGTVGGVAAGVDFNITVAVRDAYGNSRPCNAYNDSVVGNVTVSGGMSVPVSANVSVTCDAVSGRFRVYLSTFGLPPKSQVQVFMCPGGHATQCESVRAFTIGTSSFRMKLSLSTVNSSSSVQNASYGAAALLLVSAVDEETGAPLPASMSTIVTAAAAGSSTIISTSPPSMILDGTYLSLYGCACGAVMCSSACGASEEVGATVNGEMQATASKWLYQPASVSRALHLSRLGEWQVSASGVASTLPVNGLSLWSGVGQVIVALPPMPTGVSITLSCASGWSSTVVAAGGNVSLPLPDGPDHCSALLSGPTTAPGVACAAGLSVHDSACITDGGVHSVLMPLSASSGLLIQHNGTGLLPFSNSPSIPGSRVYLLGIGHGLGHASIHAGEALVLLLHLLRGDGSNRTVTTFPPGALAGSLMCPGGVVVPLTDSSVTASPALGGITMSVQAGLVTKPGICNFSLTFSGATLAHAMPVLRVLPAAPAGATLGDFSRLAPFAGPAMSVPVMITDAFGNVVEEFGEWGIKAMIDIAGDARQCIVSACLSNCSSVPTSGAVQCSLWSTGAAVLSVQAGNVTQNSTVVIMQRLPSSLTSYAAVSFPNGTSVPSISATAVGLSDCSHNMSGVPVTCTGATSLMHEADVGQNITLRMFLRDVNGAAVLAAPLLLSGITCSLCLHAQSASGEGGPSLCTTCFADNDMLYGTLKLEDSTAGRVYSVHVLVDASAGYRLGASVSEYNWPLAAASALNGLALSHAAGAAAMVLLSRPTALFIQLLAAPESILRYVPTASSYATEAMLKMALRVRQNASVEGGSFVDLPCVYIGLYVRLMPWARHDLTSTAATASNALQVLCQQDFTANVVIDASAFPQISTHATYALRLTAEIRPAGAVLTTLTATQLSTLRSSSGCTIGSSCFNLHTANPLLHVIIPGAADITKSLAFASTTTWTWFRDELSNVTAQRANGTLDKVQVYNGPRFTAQYRTSAGARINGVFGSVAKLSTAPVYSALVRRSVTTGTVTTCSVFDTCFRFSSDAAYTMYPPSDIDSWRWAALAAGPAFAVSLFNASLLLRHAAMESGTSSVANAQINMAGSGYVWSGGVEWESAASPVAAKVPDIHPLPTTTNVRPVSTPWLAAGAGSSLFLRGPADFEFPSFVTGRGSTFNALRKSLKSKQPASALDAYIVFPMARDATGNNFLFYDDYKSVFLGGTRTAHAAFDRSRLLAAKTVSSTFRSCSGEYRPAVGRHSKSYSPSVLETYWPVFSVNTTIDDGGYNGKPCYFQPLLVHATEGLFDVELRDTLAIDRTASLFLSLPTASVEPLYSTVSGSAFISRPATAVSQVKGVLHGPIRAGIDKSRAYNEWRSPQFNASFVSTRVYWLDYDGGLSAGHNMLVTNETTCQVQKEEQGVDYTSGNNALDPLTFTVTINPLSIPLLQNSWVDKNVSPLANLCGQVEHMFQWNASDDIRVRGGLGSSAALSVQLNGVHIEGSPFSITVGDSTLPSSWQDSLPTWFCGTLVAFQPGWCEVHMANGASNYVPPTGLPLWFQLMRDDWLVHPDWITAQPIDISYSFPVSTNRVNVSFTPRLAGIMQLSVFVLSSRIACSPRSIAVLPSVMDATRSIIDAVELQSMVSDSSVPPFSVVHPRVSTRAGHYNELLVRIKDKNGQVPDGATTAPPGNVTLNFSWQFSGTLIDEDDDAWVGDSYSGCTVWNVTDVITSWTQNFQYACYRAGWWQLTVTATQFGPGGAVQSGPAAVTGGPIRIQVLPSLQPFVRRLDDPELPSSMYLVGPPMLAIGTCADWHMRMRDIYGNGYVADLPWTVVDMYRPFIQPRWVNEDGTDFRAFRVELKAHSSAYTLGLNLHSVWRGYAGSGHMRIRACAFNAAMAVNKTYSLAVRYEAKDDYGTGLGARWLTPEVPSNILTMRVRLVSGPPVALGTKLLEPALATSSALPSTGCYVTLSHSADLPALLSSSPLFTTVINYTDMFGNSITDLGWLSDFNTSNGMPWLRAYVVHAESGAAWRMDRSLRQPSEAVFTLPAGIFLSGQGSIAATEGGTFRVHVYVADDAVRTPGRHDTFCVMKERSYAPWLPSTSWSGLQPVAALTAGQSFAVEVQLFDSAGHFAVNGTLLSSAASAFVAKQDLWTGTLGANVASSLVIGAETSTGRFFATGFAPNVAGKYRLSVTISNGTDFAPVYTTILGVSPLVPVLNNTCFVMIGPCGPDQSCTAPAFIQSCAGSVAVTAPRVLRLSKTNPLIVRLHVRDVHNNVVEALYKVSARPVGNVTVSMTQVGDLPVNGTAVCSERHDSSISCVWDQLPTGLVLGAVTIRIVIADLVIARWDAVVMDGPFRPEASSVEATTTTPSTVRLSNSSSISTLCTTAASLGLDTSAHGVSIWSHAAPTWVASLAAGASSDVIEVGSWPNSYACVGAGEYLFMMPPRAGSVGVTLVRSGTPVAALLVTSFNVSSALKAAPAIRAWGPGISVCNVGAHCSFRIALQQALPAVPGVPAWLPVQHWGAAAALCIEARATTLHQVCLFGIGATTVSNHSGILNISATAETDYSVSITFSLVGTAAEILLPGIAHMIELRSLVRSLPVANGALSLLVDVFSRWTNVSVLAGPAALTSATVHIIDSRRSSLNEGQVILMWTSANFALNSTGHAVASLPYNVTSGTSAVVAIILRDGAGIPILWRRASDLLSAMVLSDGPTTNASVVAETWFMGAGQFWVIIPALSPAVISSGTLVLSLPAVDGNARPKAYITFMLQPTAASSAESSDPGIVMPTAAVPSTPLQCRSGFSCGAQYGCNPDGARLLALAGVQALLSLPLAEPGVTPEYFSAGVSPSVVLIANDTSVPPTCAISVTLEVKTTGVYALSLYSGGQQIGSNAWVRVRPENEDMVGNEPYWPTTVHLAASSLTGLVSNTTADVTLVATDFYGNIARLPSGTMLSISSCTSTPGSAAYSGRNATVVVSAQGGGSAVVSIPNGVSCAVATAFSGGTERVLPIGGGIILQYPVTSPHVGITITAIMPVAQALLYSGWLALTQADADKDVDALVAADSSLPATLEFDAQAYSALLLKLALLPTDLHTTLLNTSAGEAQQCPVRSLLPGTPVNCDTTTPVIVLASAVSDDSVLAVLTQSSSVLLGLRVSRIDPMQTHAVVVPWCGQDVEHATLTVHLRTRTGSTALHTVTAVYSAAGTAWFILPPTMMAGGGSMCIEPRLSVTSPALPTVCLEGIVASPGSVARATPCAPSLRSYGAGSCGTTADATRACPMWAPVRCLADSSCREAESACPTLPSGILPLVPVCPNDAPILCGPTGVARTAACVQDTYTCALKDPPAALAVQICPAGYALCPLFAGVDDAPSCVPLAAYPSACASALECGLYRVRCWDGYCFEEPAETLISRALGLTVPTLAALAPGGLVNPVHTTCPPYAEHRLTAPAAGSVTCPASRPTRCEDGTCVLDAVACLGGVVGQYSRSVAAVLAVVTRANVEDAIRDIRAAQAQLHGVVSCPSLASSSMRNTSSIVGPIRSSDSTCTHSLHHALSTPLLPCAGDKPVLCAGGIICAASLDQCPALEACPAATPWFCIANGGVCTMSRVSCTELANDAFGALAAGIANALSKKAGFALFITTPIGILVLVMLVLFLLASLCGLCYVLGREGAKLRRAEIMQRAGVEAAAFRPTRMEEDVEQKGSRFDTIDSPRKATQPRLPQPVLSLGTRLHMGFNLFVGAKPGQQSVGRLGLDAFSEGGSAAADTDAGMQHFTHFNPMLRLDRQPVSLVPSVASGVETPKTPPEVGFGCGTSPGEGIVQEQAAGLATAEKPC